MRFMILATLSFLLSSCGNDEANHRGFVISKTKELVPEVPVEQVQP